MKSLFALVVTAGVLGLAVACSSDNSTGPRLVQAGPDTACVKGTLSVGQTINGDLNVASSCFYPDVWDSTVAADTAIGQSYNFTVQKGKGYLVSLLTTNESNDQLRGGTKSAPELLEIADYEAPYQSTLPFVADSSTTYSVRVSSDDQHYEADTGAYVLRAQTCEVPVPMVTDSVTVVDSLASNDCTDPQSDLSTEDSSHVDLYTVHFANNGGTRTFYFTVPSSTLAVEGAGPGYNGGPGWDPYCYNCASSVDQRSIGTGSYSFTAADSGVYTFILASTQYSVATVPYTLSIGNEVPPGPLHVTPAPGFRSLNAAPKSVGRAIWSAKHKH